MSDRIRLVSLNVRGMHGDRPHRRTVLTGEFRRLDAD
jgi:hypothetical protein